MRDEAVVIVMSKKKTFESPSENFHYVIFGQLAVLAGMARFITCMQYALPHYPDIKQHLTLLLSE